MTQSAIPHVHSPENCFQTETLRDIQYSMKAIIPTLKRLDEQGERTSRALEQIAAQGAVLESHEKRLDEQTKALNEAFRRINQSHTSLTGKFDSLSEQVQGLMVRHAAEDGEKKVLEKVEAKEEKAQEEAKKFWTEVKIQALTPIGIGVFFALWLADKLGAVTRIIELFKEFKG